MTARMGRPAASVRVVAVMVVVLSVYGFILSPTSASIFGDSNTVSNKGEAAYENTLRLRYTGKAQRNKMASWTTVVRYRGTKRQTGPQL